MSSLATHVIFTYNDLVYLLQALDMSVSSSKRVSKDILVIDDGSSTPVELVLRERYDFNREKISIVRLPQNKGIQEAIKIALQHVRTKYVHLGSSNDKLSSVFFYNHVQALEKYGDAPFSSSDPGIFDEGRGSYSDFKLSLSSRERFFSPSELVNIYRKFPFHIGSNTVLYRTEDLKDVGVRTDLELYADWYINYFLAFRKGFVYIPEVLSYFCIHQNSYSASQLKKDNTDKVVRFFQYVHDADLNVYRRMKRACFVSAFPLWDVIRTLKYPVIKDCTSVRALSTCFLRKIWRVMSKFLPTFLYNKIRRINIKTHHST